jgi:hypothetical protein
VLRLQEVSLNKRKVAFIANIQQAAYSLNSPTKSLVSIFDKSVVSSLVF